MSKNRTTKDDGKRTLDYRDVLLTHLASNSPVSEAFRILRTNIMLDLARDGADRRLGSILVTSTGRGEGKTSICANLALILAQVGMKVALVDADLRLPSQHLAFDVTPTVNLGTIIERAATNPDGIADDAVTIREDLDLFANGGLMTDHPAEVLASDPFRNFIAALEERYDAVIIDTPPISLVTDAAIVAQYAGASLFAVSTAQRNRQAVRLAFAELQRSRARILGTVMNRVEVPRSRTYGSGYYMATGSASSE